MDKVQTSSGMLVCVVTDYKTLPFSGTHWSLGNC